MYYKAEVDRVYKIPVNKIQRLIFSKGRRKIVLSHGSRSTKEEKPLTPIIYNIDRVRLGSGEETRARRWNGNEYCQRRLRELKEERKTRQKLDNIPRELRPGRQGNEPLYGE